MTRLTYFNPNLDSEVYIGNKDLTLVQDPKQGNLVSSLCDDGSHMPVLDVDVMDPHRARAEILFSWKGRLDPSKIRVIPSTTPGHNHIYIDERLSWPEYEFFLSLMHRRGVIEKGYYQSSVKEHATYVRPPGVKKKETAKKIPKLHQAVFNTNAPLSEVQTFAQNHPTSYVSFDGGAYTVTWQE